MLSVIRLVEPDDRIEVLVFCSGCHCQFWEDFEHAVGVSSDPTEELLCINCDKEADVPAIVMPPPYFQDLDL